MKKTYKEIGEQSTQTRYRALKKGKSWLFGCSAVLLIGSSMLAAQTASAVGGTGSNLASSQSIKSVDGIIASAWLGDSYEYYSGQVNRESVFRMVFEFELPNDTIHSKDTTVVKLSDNIEFFQVYSFNIVSSDGDVVASANMDAGTKTVTLTWTDFVEDHANIKGTFQFQARVDTANAQQYGTLPVSVTVGDEEIQVEDLDYVAYVADKDETIATNKTSLNNEGSSYSYWLRVNAAGKSYENFTATARGGHHTEIIDRSSIKIYKGKWVISPSTGLYELDGKTDVTDLYSPSFIGDDLSIDFGPLNGEGFYVEFRGDVEDKIFDGDSLGYNYGTNWKGEVGGGRFGGIGEVKSWFFRTVSGQAEGDLLQKVVYNVIDDDAKDPANPNLESNVLFDKGLAGDSLTKTQANLQTIIDGYTAKGYDLVSPVSIPTGFDADDETDQIITIHLKHHIDTVTPENNPKGYDVELFTAVNQTIYHVFEDNSKAADDVTDSIKFSREAKVDATDGTVQSYSNWDATGGIDSFSEKISPTIQGYTPDKDSIPEVLAVTADSPHIEETVVHVAHTQRLLYNVIDDTEQKNLETNVVLEEGPTHSPMSTTMSNLQAIADGYLSKGYEIVSIDTPPTHFNNDRTLDQVVNIHLKKSGAAVVTPIGTPGKTVPISTVETKTSVLRLPSTGDEHRTAVTVLGAALVAASGFIGIVLHKKRKRD